MYVLRIRMGHRVLLSITFLLLAVLSFGQYGIRAIIWNYEPVVGGNGDLLPHIGIGVDHDINERISNAVQFRMAFSSDIWVLNYRTAYHFADTDGPSFYMGPMVGLRSIKGEVDQRMLFPLGLRAGVRGGLRGFFADLYAALVYNVGARDPIILSDQREPSNIVPVTYCIGLDMGLGWDKR
jgi:hypothetical protein